MYGLRYLVNIMMACEGSLGIKMSGKMSSWPLKAVLNENSFERVIIALFAEQRRILEPCPAFYSCTSYVID